jgi:hypothetical protein
MLLRAIVVIGMLILSCSPRQATSIPGRITFSGGSGEAFHDAVVISGTRNKSEGIAGEYSFISKLHGKRGEGWQLVGQTVIREKNKIVDVVEIQLGSVSDRRIYYFDVSDFLGKRR